jgi:hypothetical protein
MHGSSAAAARAVVAWAGHRYVGRWPPLPLASPLVHAMGCSHESHIEPTVCMARCYAIQLLCAIHSLQAPQRPATDLLLVLAGVALAIVLELLTSVASGLPRYLRGVHVRAPRHRLSSNSLVA